MTAPAEPDPATHPSTARRRPRRILIAAAAGLVLLGGIGAALVRQVGSEADSPASLAQDYLDALEAGQASVALELVPVEPEVLDGYGEVPVETVLLTDSIYAAATDRPTGGRVTRVDRSGDEATITIEYQQGDERVTQTLTALRVDGSGSLPGRWELQPAPIGTVTVRVPTSTTADLDVSANGVPLNDQDLWAVAALPGTYTFDGEPTEWLETDEVTVTLLGDGEAKSSRALTRPSAALTERAPQLVEDHLARCLATTLADPPDCPNLADLGSELTDVAWTLDLAPEYELTASHYGDGFTVRGTAAGSATITGTLVEDTAGQAAGETWTARVEIDLDGYVYVKGGTVWYEAYGEY
ncbi:MAG TPA: hypothetical protein VGC67_08580 [Cellulomonas sp.]